MHLKTEWVAIADLILPTERNMNLMKKRTKTKIDTIRYMQAIDVLFYSRHYDLRIKFEFKFNLRPQSRN